MKARGDVHANKCCHNLECPVGRYYFLRVIPASGTRQIEKTFIKGLLTIQVQELRKSHNKPKLRQQYRKSRFSGDKMAPLTVSFPPHLSRHIGCFREFPKSARIGNSFLVLLGCPFGRYDLGATSGGCAQCDRKASWAYPKLLGI